MILVGIGSNLQNPVTQVNLACTELQKKVSAKLYKSSLWETKPVGCAPDSSLFINAVVAFEQTLENFSPLELMYILQDLEKKFGRPEIYKKNAPRVLDLDIILFHDLIYASPSLILPHPRALLRHFVLGPAAELVPDLIWPRTSKTIKVLLQSLPETNWGFKLSD